MSAATENGRGSGRELGSAGGLSRCGARLVVPVGEARGRVYCISFWTTTRFIPAATKALCTSSTVL